MNKEQLWQSILGELELILSKANFSTWFKDTFISAWEDEKIVVGVPNTFTQSWLQNKYHSAIQTAYKNINGNPAKEISYRVESIKKSTQNTPPQYSIQQSPDPQTQQNHVQTQTKPSPVGSFGLNHKYRFENFIVGKNNELAHAAAKAIAQSPGQTYNPFFIYGGVGLGKTHLLQAIGHEILQHHPQLKVLYTSCEKFTNDFVQSIKNGTTSKFQSYYRDIDLLIVDDIQFMAGKDQTQEQFFHTFNDLHQNNKQIIISSDRPPSAIPTIEERLKSRFSWGMIADIGSPDLETRIAILDTKVSEKNLHLDREIINYIASVVQTNIRELEGALNRIVAHLELTKTEPSLDNVKTILSNITPQNKKGVITPRQVIKEVTDFYDVTIDSILGSSRKKELVTPRQIIMFLIRKETNASFPNIGAELGGRDHTTVMHACKKISKELETNEKLDAEINAIKQRLYNQHSS